MRFELFTSEFVLEEASRGDPQAAAERMSVAQQLALVPIDQAAIDLAAILVSRHAMPAKASVDAAHVAIAAANSIEFLLTWNCKHLANAMLRATIEQACRDSGFQPPIICTPFELNEVWP